MKSQIFTWAFLFNFLCLFLTCVYFIFQISFDARVWEKNGGAHVTEHLLSVLYLILTAPFVICHLNALRKQKKGKVVKLISG